MTKSKKSAEYCVPHNSRNTYNFIAKSLDESTRDTTQTKRLFRSYNLLLLILNTLIQGITSVTCFANTSTVCKHVQLVF